VLGEWVRAAGDMGFPWLRLASTQLHYVPILQIAGVLGELGVSLFVASINVVVVVGWQSWRGGFPALGRAFLSRWWAPMTLLVLFGSVYGYGFATMRQLEADDPTAPSLEVGVIQANVNLMDKWDPSKRDSTFVPYTLLTRRAAADRARLVIWGETAVPLDLPRSPEYLERVRMLVRETSTYLLTGFPERVIDEDGLLVGYNSSLLMDDDGVIRDRYRKMHLLAFGERIPFQGILPILGRIDFGQAEWAPGPIQTIFEVDGHRFANLICFESIFSRLARSAVRGGAAFLVNMSNDGWFGDTLLPYQHAWMAVMRAAENRVPLVRCANNGISFVALPSGRVIDQTRLFQREYFVQELQPRPGGSFYTRYGDIPLFVLIVAGFVFVLLVGRTASRV
jgi:apolipoprotein N-acyltransferase